MQTMSKEEVEKWCEESNYLLVDLSKKKIPVEIVLRIAQEAVEVKNIQEKTHGHKHSFGRYLTMEYLFNKMNTASIAPLVGLERSMVYHAKKQQLLNTDLKFFKGWQRNAIVFFKDKIQEIELSF